jgi:hypothetical protein
MKKPFIRIILCVLAVLLVGGFIVYKVEENKPNPAFTDSIGDNIKTIWLQDCNLGYVTVTKKEDINRIYGFLKGLKLKEYQTTTSTQPIGAILRISIITNDGTEYVGNFEKNSLGFDKACYCEPYVDKWYKVKGNYYTKLMELYDEYLKSYKLTLCNE